jgi:5-methylcytosine-specific restriction protein B
MNQLLEIVYNSSQEGWYERNQDAFEELFGAKGGRYPANALKNVTLRAPELRGDNIPFAAYIQKSNPDSGPYGGMSFVIFPVEQAPCLIALVVGTQGLSPDEEILGRPGHARRMAGICSWLNHKYGQGTMIAWAKKDPFQTELDIPKNIKQTFSAYSTVFQKYGRVTYGLYAPTEDKVATREALCAFLDLMFTERGVFPLSGAEKEAVEIRSQYFAHLIPDVSQQGVYELLQDRRYVVLEGPPGTGKTRMARMILRDSYEGRGISIQFHPNMTYENFVGGLAPVTTEDGFGFRFAPQKGFLMKAVEAAWENPDKPYLLHIDEINRADLSKVLGEAIFLMEHQADEERELQLPYDFGSPFFNRLSLPANLHILGTMNSADRSIAIVDIAVRRRFAFVKLWPQLRVVQEHAGELMEKAFVDLLSIFVDYATEDSFSLIPGHSYFLEKDDEKAIHQLKVNLIPLLEEYLAQGYVTSFSDYIRAYIQWINSL